MTTMMFGPGNNVFGNEEFDCSCESCSRNDVVNVRASMEGNWGQEAGLARFLLAKAGFVLSNFENWQNVGSRNKISAECWNWVSWNLFEFMEKLELLIFCLWSVTD